MIQQRNHQKAHLVLCWRSICLEDILSNELEYLCHQLLGYMNQLDIKLGSHYQQRNTYQSDKL